MAGQEGQGLPKWKSLSHVWLLATPHSTVHGILQARILEWVAFPFSRGSSQSRDRTQVSRIAGGLLTSWATREAQEYWNGQPIPSPVDLPNSEIKPGSPPSQADSLTTEVPGKTKGFAFFRRHTALRSGTNQNSSLIQYRTSLVAQWLRLRLPMQGTQVNPWFGKIARAKGQLSPCTTTTEACMP